MNFFNALLVSTVCSTLCACSHHNNNKKTEEQSSRQPQSSTQHILEDNSHWDDITIKKEFISHLAKFKDLNQELYSGKDGFTHTQLIQCIDNSMQEYAKKIGFHFEFKDSVSKARKFLSEDKLDLQRFAPGAGDQSRSVDEILKSIEIIYSFKNDFNHSYNLMSLSSLVDDFFVINNIPNEKSIKLLDYIIGLDALNFLEILKDNNINTSIILEKYFN